MTLQIWTFLVGHSTFNFSSVMTGSVRHGAITMRIAEVIGKVTLSRANESLIGAKWVIATPLQREALQGESSGRGEPFVIYDELGANSETRIAVSEGGEASNPFYPDVKPIDAYTSAIFDSIEVS